MGKQQFIPCRLDIDQFLADNPPDFPHHRDHFVRVLHFMYEIPSTLGKKRLKNGWVSVSVEILRQWGIRHGGKILSHLIAHGVLRTDNLYIEDEKCRWYKFQPYYNSYPKIEYITKISLIKHMVNQTPLKRNKRTHPYLSKWLNPNLQLDAQAALIDCERKMQMDSVKRMRYGWKKFPKDPFQAYTSALISINKIEQGDFFFTKDQTSGRFHSNLTNMGKIARNHLTYSGHPLVSVDIKNSQPTFSTPLASEKFFRPDISHSKNPMFSILDLPKSMRKEIEKVWIENRTGTGGVWKGHEVGAHTFTVVETPQLAVNEELEIYRSKVQDGIFYEYIFERAPKVLGYELDLTRDQLKVEVLKAMYSSNRYSTPVKQVFSHTFPYYNSIFRMLKKQEKSLLPRVLQAVEASIVLDRAAKRISIEEPKLFIATVHDSIVTLKGYEDYVAAIMQEEVQAAIGITPRLGIEFWSPDNIDRNEMRNWVPF